MHIRRNMRAQNPKKRHLVRGRERTRAANRIQRWWRRVRQNMTTASIVLQWRAIGLTAKRMAGATAMQYYDWMRDSAVERATYQCMGRMLFLCAHKGRRSYIEVFKRTSILIFGCVYFADTFLDSHNSHVHTLRQEAEHAHQAFEDLCSAFEATQRPSHALRKSYLEHFKAYNTAMIAMKEEQQDRCKKALAELYLQYPPNTEKIQDCLRLLEAEDLDSSRVPIATCYTPVDMGQQQYSRYFLQLLSPIEKEALTCCTHKAMAATMGFHIYFDMCWLQACGTSRALADLHNNYQQHRLQVVNSGDVQILYASLDRHHHNRACFVNLTPDDVRGLGLTQHFRIPREAVAFTVKLGRAPLLLSTIQEQKHKRNLGVLLVKPKTLLVYKLHMAVARTPKVWRLSEEEERIAAKRAEQAMAEVLFG